MTLQTIPALMHDIAQIEATLKELRRALVEMQSIHSTPQAQPIIRAPRSQAEHIYDLLARWPGGLTRVEIFAALIHVFPTEDGVSQVLSRNKHWFARNGRKWVLAPAND